MLMAIFSASISILCIIFYLGIMAYLHITNKHIYSPIHHAVSDYGVGQGRKYFLLAGYSGIIRNIFIAIALVAWKYVFTFKSIAIIMLIFTLVGFIGVTVLLILKGRQKLHKGGCIFCLQYSSSLH